MALVACPHLYFPDPLYFNGGAAPSVQSVLLDAAADRVAAVFRAPKTGNIHKIGIRFGTVPVLTTSTLTIGLQDVSLTTGDPDGTFDQSATIATGSIVANTFLTTTLGADRAVTRNDLMAAVVQFDTFIALDQVNIVVGQLVQTRSGPFNFGYNDNNTSGAYAKANGVVADFSIEYDDGSYAPIPSLWPALVDGSVAFQSGSTPDEIGLRFQTPFPCKIGGCHLGIDPTGDFQINFYDASSKTVCATQDKDQKVTVGMVSPLMFNSEITLAANTTYVLSVEPTSGTNVTLGYLDVSSAAVLDQLASGQQCHYATAKNPSTTADFTMTTTRRPSMGLIITAVDDGTSTVGSGINRPRIQLGM